LELVERPTEFDVFLSSPMVAADDYAEEKDVAAEVKAALERSCGMSVFHAIGDPEREAEFDQIAIEAFFEALPSSRYYVLLTLTAPTRPSSVYVEAGFALALKIPSLYLVPTPETLPFIMRTLGHYEDDGLPPVRIECVDSGPDAVALLNSEGTDLFERLDRS
jgi:hypothetical protein